METCGVWLDTARARARGGRQTRIAAFFPPRAGGRKAPAPAPAPCPAPPPVQPRPCAAARLPRAEGSPRRAGCGRAASPPAASVPAAGPARRRAGREPRDAENAAPAAEPRPGRAVLAGPLRPLTNTVWPRQPCASPGAPDRPGHSQGTAFAQLFTQDSEGCWVISHRQLQAGLGSPPRKKARQDGTDSGGGASSPSTRDGARVRAPAAREASRGPDSSQDWLFTEDSEGNRVIRHPIRN